MRKSLKALLFVTLMLLVVASITACKHEHIWIEATCTEPRTCSECGETEGEALGHDWIEATCTEAKHCSRCGETEGEPLGHDWLDATCTEPVTCSRCGETAGNPLGHTWVEATCTEPKTCSVCGETEGEALEHVWIEATYEAPKTCSVCGETEGDPLLHEIPQGYIDMYEFGEFSRFNSPASENGLGDTIIWFIGQYDEVTDLDLSGAGTPAIVYIAVVTDSDGNKWLVELDIDYYTSAQKYYDLVGHTLCFIGAYQGFSEVYQEPVVLIKQIFDQNTGNMITCALFEDNY